MSTDLRFNTTGGKLEDYLLKSHQRIDTLFQEENVSHQNTPAFLLDLSEKWTAHLMKCGASTWFLWDALIATERSMPYFQDDRKTLKQLHVTMSSIYARGSNWTSSSLMDGKDILEQAIHHEKIALRLSEELRESPSEHLQVLSSLHEQRYESFNARRDLQEAVRFMDEAAKYMTEPYKGVAKAVVATLHFTEKETALQSVVEVPFAAISEHPISISHATRQRFRFVDCRQIVERKSLRVFELQDLPWARYAALSYPWRGLENHEPNLVQFTIEGASDADPVNLEILTIACEAALRHDCQLLWFDALCIKQDDAEDKAWQIQRMYDVYKHCRECLIFPGGLTRLAAIDEPTTWLQRAWTLQEAVAPASSQVIFAWDLGDVLLQHNFFIQIDEIVRGKAGTSNLRSLLMMAGFSPQVRRRTVSGSTTAGIPERSIDNIALLGNIYHARLALLGALDHRSWGGGGKYSLRTQRIITSSENGTTKSEEGFANAIWRSAMTRVASRPVDAVFSIMGLFNVTLDPRTYEVNERARATIDLMRGFLQQGYRAEWLGLSPSLPLHDRISTMPAFPSYSSDGQLVVKSYEGEVQVPLSVDGGWKLCHAPFGSITPEGRFKLSAKVAPARKLQPGQTVPAGEISFGSLSTKRAHAWDVVDGHEWQIVGRDYEDTSTHALAVFVGTEEQYLNGAIPRYVDPWNHLLMLVQKQQKGGYRNICFANVKKEVLDHPAWYEETIEVS